MRGVEKHLEFIGNVGVQQHFEACTGDVLERHQIRLVLFKKTLGDFDHRGCSEGWQHRYIAEVVWDLEGDYFDQCIHHWVHDKSSPSMDGTFVDMRAA